MPFFKKPDVGSLTENWPELCTAPVNYDDSVDPEHYLLEQKAIFKKTWLKVGRVEQLPKRGSYFTREMPSAPGEFADLQRFTDWCLPTEEERYAKRLASSMAEMQELYDAGLARLEDIMVYVDARFPLEGMPDDAKALVHLGQSIVMVSFPIEVWKQPRVLDSGAAYITLIKEPVVSRC